MMTIQPLILASTSPFKKVLLEQTGLPFVVQASEYQEDMSLPVPPEELARVLSYGKAQAVAAQHDRGVVIGADSIAVIGDTILGKPTDEADARRMLERLSGSQHTMMTGLTIIDAASGKEMSETCATDVYFRKLSPADIRGYLATGEWRGCAGAYSIQRRAAMLIERIDGEYGTIIGLPLGRLAELLREFSVEAFGEHR